MIKNKYIIITILFMAFIGLQIAEPAAAAKGQLIDKGKKVNDDITLIWTTYQYKTHVILTTKSYIKGKLDEKVVTKIQRLNRKIILVIKTQKGKVDTKIPHQKAYFINNEYIYAKSKLKLKNFYFKYLDPRLEQHQGPN